MFFGKDEWRGLIEVVEDRPEFGRGLGIRHARLEPAHQREIALPFHFVCIRHLDGQVDIGAAPQKTRRHDADDGARMAIDLRTWPSTDGLPP